MKGYYIFYGSNSSGVTKKIDMQLQEMNKIASIDLLTVNLMPRTRKRKVLARVPWKPLGYDYRKLTSQIKNPDFIYIRRVTADCDYISFLRYIRETYPKCKIIIEIFTYPYDKDDYNKNFFHLLRNFPYYIKDLYYRRFLKKYVNRFVTYSDDTSIFGVRTITTANGIISKDFSPIPSTEKNSSEINLISVAHMQVHHGYERVIKGMNEYYKKGGNREIIYHVVGDGPETKKYKKLVEKFHLQNNIIFYGRKSGKDLDDLYDIADIALASFGLYKYDINVISTLKTCEYLIKGLPVATGCKISTANDEQPPFVCEFENNNTPLDMNKLIRFYDEVYGLNKRADVISRLNSYARANMDMSVVMKPIIDYIISE